MLTVTSNDTCERKRSDPCSTDDEWPSQGGVLEMFYLPAQPLSSRRSRSMNASPSDNGPESASSKGRAEHNRYLKSTLILPDTPARSPARIQTPCGEGGPFIALVCIILSRTPQSIPSILVVHICWSDVLLPVSRHQFLRRHGDPGAPLPYRRQDGYAGAQSRHRD